VSRPPGPAFSTLCCDALETDWDTLPNARSPSLTLSAIPMDRALASVSASLASIGAATSSAGDLGTLQAGTRHQSLLAEDEGIDVSARRHRGNRPGCSLVQDEDTRADLHRCEGGACKRVSVHQSPRTASPNVRIGAFSGTELNGASWPVRARGGLPPGFALRDPTLSTGSIPFQLERCVSRVQSATHTLPAANETSVHQADTAAATEAAFRSARMRPTAGRPKGRGAAH
jgi:hypothetical protein